MVFEPLVFLSKKVKCRINVKKKTQQVQGIVIDLHYLLYCLNMRTDKDNLLKGGYFTFSEVLSL